MRTVAALSLSLPVVLAFLAGCRRDEEPTRESFVRAPAVKPQGQPIGDSVRPEGSVGAPSMPSNLPPGHPPLRGGPAGNGPAAGGMPGMAGDVPPPPPVADGSGLKWTLPVGWTESRTGGMRFATLKPSADAKVDVSVVVLGGAAGGELANVNRWRGQLGLSPTDEAGLAASRKVIGTKAGQVALFDLESAGAVKSRMLVGYLVKGDNTWFLKMTGDSAAVGAQSQAFSALLQSLSF